MLFSLCLRSDRLLMDIPSSFFSLITVLQECATDSEELIYPIRAPSSCSAPPDLLLTSDRNKDTKVQSNSQHVDVISPDRMLLEVSFKFQVGSTEIRNKIQFFVFA